MLEELITIKNKILVFKLKCFTIQMVLQNEIQVNKASKKRAVMVGRIQIAEKIKTHKAKKLPHCRTRWLKM